MDKPSLFDKVNFNVKLVSSKLVCIMLYPIPYAKEEMLWAEINYFLQEDIISPAESYY